MANIQAANRHISIFGCGFSVSPRLARLNEEFIKNGGKWEKRKIGTLFRVESNPQLNKESFVFSENAEYPYFTRTVNNNGILGYVEYLDDEHLIKGNSLAVGMLGMEFFYMGQDFYAGQFTKTIYAKGFTLNPALGIFFVSLFNRCQEDLKSVLVRDFEERFLSLEIDIPIKRNQIDTDFIERYINVLTVDCISQINSFLEKNALTDCALTATEETAVRRIRYGKVRWQSFPMNGLFVPLKAPYLRKGTRRQDHVSRIRTKEFCLPVVCAKRGDNGIMKFGRREDFISYSNVLSIIYNGAIAAGLVYAHEEEVGIFTDSYLIKWKGSEIPFDANLFLKTTIQKKIYPIYSREQKATWQKRVENEEINLPINTRGEIDVPFMLAIVRAEKKLAARKIIAYKNELEKELISHKHQATKPIIIDDDDFLRHKDKANFIPLYTLRAACGHFAEGQEAEKEGWIDVYEQGFRPDAERQFAVYAKGHSMEPKIQDGDICVFEWYHGGSREGEIVLTECNQKDLDYGGMYTIKKYHSEKVQDKDGWRHSKIELQPLNKEYDTITWAEEKSEEYRTIGILKKVLNQINIQPVVER